MLGIAWLVIDTSFVFGLLELMGEGRVGSERMVGPEGEEGSEKERVEEA